MKKTISLTLSIFSVLLIIMSIPISSYAATSSPLDEIQSYQIKIDPRIDGTLDMQYTVVWKVLDDKSEGPLEWIKIGNPNSHVDEITALSKNIKKIRYYPESGKSFIRIDLDRQYKAGEIITLKYSIHQKRMYIVEEENHLVRYSFTAGWFEDINVKNIRVLWNEKNVIEATTEKKEDGYYIWEDSLKMGERFNVSIKYNADVFDYDLNNQYTEGNQTSGGTVILIIFVGLFVLIIIVCVIAYVSDDGYDGGFGGTSGGSSVYIHTHSSCARSSCACVSSCACACACAGGGRAGCTKKDFYHTNLKVEDLEEILKK